MLARNVTWTVVSGGLALGLFGLCVAVYAVPEKATLLLASAAIVPTADTARGKNLILAKGCGGCHTIPGIPGANGQLGPYLGGVGARPRIAAGSVPNRGPEDLQRWLLDPPSLKPGTQMPKLGLSDAEAAAIASYLGTLP